jgi:hypothetical protein
MMILTVAIAVTGMIMVNFFEWKRHVAAMN